MDRSPIDRTADRPVHKQVADRLRSGITSGVWGPGDFLPGEHALAEDYEVSRNSIREALSALRKEGLIETVPQIGSRVRPVVEATVVQAPAGTEVSARMPTAAERRALALPEGVPLLVLSTPAGESQVLPADRYLIRLAG